MEQMPGISPLGLSSCATCALCEHRLGLGPSGAQPCAGDWNSAGLTAHPRCVQHLSAVNSCRAKGSHLSMGNPLVCKDGGALVWKDLVKIRCRICTSKKNNNSNTNTFLGTSDALGVDKATSHVLPPSLYHQPHLLALRAQFGASTVLGEPGIWVWICPQYPALFPPSMVFITLLRELC